MPNLRFEDPRLRMTLSGRMFIRVGSVMGYLLLLALAVTSLLSSVAGLRWIGVFLWLVLLDRLLHRNECDVPIPELKRREDINVAQAIPPRLVPVLQRAHEVSKVAGTDITLEIGRVLLLQEEIQEGLARLDIDTAEISAKLEEFLKREEAHVVQDREQRIASLGNIICLAFEAASRSGHSCVSATDIFSVLPALPGPDGGKNLMDRLFTVFDIDPGDLERAFIFTTAREHKDMLGRLPGEISGLVLPADRGVRHRVMNRAWTSRPTPTLDQYAVDFTDAARGQEIGFLIGHNEEYEHMINILARDSNPNALLVGTEGVGKEVLMAHLAFQIEKDNVPPVLFDRRLVSLNLASLVAGGSPEELQERLGRIVSEINAAGNVILIIPDIHNLLKTSGAAYLSAADAFLPIIRDNIFPVLGTSFPNEYRQMIAPRSDFNSLFEMVDVKEISVEDAEKVLVYQALVLEHRTKKTITFGAVKMAVSLGKKYFHNLPLPGSAIELLKSAVASSSSKIVDHEAIIEVAESRVNVPLHASTPEENKELLNLEATIHKRLIGQDEAVKVVSDALRQYRSGLSRAGGPIASFLFVGPTGVGKTELAKTLATIQFGSEANMMRFDMTEYKEKSSITRFIGAADGSVPGALTEAVKKQPYGLILLDEFEKASPEILDIFLQVLDDGRLTDASGQVLSFENTIVIATSNAHSDLVNESLRKGEPIAQIADYLKQRLTDVFKPELINRFSRVVIFHDLNLDDMQKIAVIELRKLVGSVEERGLSLIMAPEVVTKIAKIGYDPSFGARPLRRAIDEHIRAPLAEWLLANNPARGSEIRIDLADEKFVFSSSLT